ncbi:unnamed protein product, partial [marine sediment metagenome]
MAAVVIRLNSVNELSKYLNQVVLEGKAADIDRVIVKGLKFLVLGEDLNAYTGVSPSENATILADEEALLNFLVNGTLPTTWNVKNVGLKYLLAGISGTVRSPEATDVLAKFTGLTTAEEDALADFTDAEVINGNFGTKAL